MALFSFNSSRQYDLDPTSSSPSKTQLVNLIKEYERELESLRRDLLEAERVGLSHIAKIEEMQRKIEELEEM